MRDSGGELLGGVPVQWGSFLDTPPGENDPDSARVVIIPVPYDGTASFKGGARYGPRAIINASRHLEDYDIELDRDISQVGIHTAPEIIPDASGPRAVIEQVRRAVASVLARGKLPVVLGGEHTVTVGAVQALAAIHHDLSVLYLDAHADLRDEYMGTSWGHASVARRLCELCPVVHVGVRSISADEMNFVKEKRLPVTFWTGEAPTASELAERVLSQLSANVYISIDLDVLDPSLMAAVGTPEPGGMTWREVTGLLREVARHRRVVGFDLTELAPNEGPEACAFTAAKLAYKLIGYATSS